AQHQNELPKFFKRYQIQPVWRADRPARGRFREFFQCDIDAIGSDSPLVEAELISAVCEVMTRLGFQGFVLRLNHRLVLHGLLNIAGVPGSQHDQALISLDKLDKVGVDGVARELAARGIDAAVTKRCLEVFEAAGPERPADTLRRLEAIFPPNDTALVNLRAIV